MGGESKGVLALGRVAESENPLKLKTGGYRYPPFCFNITIQFDVTQHFLRATVNEIWQTFVYVNTAFNAKFKKINNEINEWFK